MKNRITRKQAFQKVLSTYLVPWGPWGVTLPKWQRISRRLKVWIGKRPKIVPAYLIEDTPEHQIYQRSMADINKAVARMMRMVKS